MMPSLHPVAKIDTGMPTHWMRQAQNLNFIFNLGFKVAVKRMSSHKNIGYFCNPRLS